jgi:hypothetical protein
MRTPPESFVEKLDREFRGRLRIRWSTEDAAWHVEQKVARGMFPGTKPSKKGWDESTDAYIRHRDGVILVISVRTGDRMPCPKCGHELKVPYLQTHLVTCAFCKLRGKQSHVPAVYFPLSDSLIQFLKSIDPENPVSEGLAEDLDVQNEALAAMLEKDALTAGNAAAEQEYRRIVGIPQVGLSGNTKMWIK